MEEAIYIDRPFSKPGPDAHRDEVSMTLSEEHLTVILNVLCRIAHRWEEIATYLRMSEASISIVRAKQCEADKKLFDIMKRWLSETSPQPTVKGLVDALRSSFLSENLIASEIEEKLSQTRLHAAQSLQKSISLPVVEPKPASHDGANYNRFESSPAHLSHDTDKSCNTLVQLDHSLDQSSSPDSTNEGAYECCCEERCSIIDIASGKCPKQKSTLTHFPLLAAQRLSKPERNLLCGHVRKQFEDISENFADLVDSIQESLKSRGVKAKELTRKLMLLKGFIPHNKANEELLLQDRISEMKAAETIDDVFDILNDYWSFFSYKIIKYIVKKLGTGDDKKNLKSYEDNFTEYCRRSVFECPYCICPQKSPHFTELVMKVVSDSMIKPYSMEAIQLFQAEVSSLLYITKYTLKLCSVEEGCLQLKFQIPHFLSKVLFPLSADQIKGLKGLGVIKMACDGVSQLPESVTHEQGSHFEKSVEYLPESLHQVLTEEENREAHEQAIDEKQKGDVHLKKKEYRLAVESYTKAMELDPSNALIPTSKAEALLAQGLYKDAVESCCLSLNMDNCNSEAYLIRARANNRLGNLEDAVKDFVAALKLDPNNSRAMTEMARLEGELRRRAKLQQDEGVTKSDLTAPDQECKEGVCKLPHKPLPELEVVKMLDEWESLRALVGEEVLVSSSLSQKVPVHVFEMEGSVIGLFFSGIWCPPSREFTPKLISWYNDFKKGPNGHLLNIIFISSDEDEASWREYSAKMPWHGIHFNDKKRQEILHTKYNIEWIPTLIFIDGKTGKVISENGDSIIENDPTGNGFPWKPKPFSEIVTNAKFIDQNEKAITWEELQGKIIGLFFSSYSYPVGIEFTFQLVEMYNKLKEANKEFDIIYVSFDESRQDWKGYSALMPWISLQYKDACTEDLIQLFQVSEIPQLILLNEKGGLITTKGYTCVSSDPNGENFPWYVSTLTKFTSDDLTGSAPARLIWFVPNHIKERAYEVLRPLAEEYISKKAAENMKVKLLFFIADEENEASESIRSFAHLPSHLPLLAILDIAHKQVHVSDSGDVTEENARKFIYAYLKKQLLGRSLKM